MQDYTSDKIRNVVLLSHSGAGKTSLSESMLFASGAITRLGRIEDGNTTSDYDSDEVQRQISINLSLLPCPWEGVKINLIDTPGYADFVGEVMAAVRIADAAVIVVCAASGVEVGTEQAWKRAEDRALPRLILVNKMERENANFQQILEQIKAKFGKKCIPVQLPIGSQSEFRGLVDLVSMKACDASGQEVPIPSSEEAASFHEELVESVIEVDDGLVEKYLDGQEITEQEIQRALREATITGRVVPILVGSALRGIGVTQLMDVICQNLPSPVEQGGVEATNMLTQQQETIEQQASAPLSALVFKTTADPYVGKLTYFRVYTGSIYSNSQVWNVTANQAERLGQLFVLRGKTQEPVPHLIAGDIGGTAKLSATGTGDTLCNKDHPLKLAPVEFPPPCFSVAVHPKTKEDLDKLGSVLSRMVEEDPTLHLHKEPDTGETILSGMGDSQLDVVTERMRHKFGVHVLAETPNVPYKETISISTRVEYKHKKQTGGHGQYGHVLLELEPLPRGTGFEFVDKIVGGRVPKNYIPAVEKGVVEACQEGGLAGYPVTDVKVTLYDGSFHPVDSSDICFKIAGAQGLKKGAAQAQPVLLEPIMHLSVTVPDEFTGDVVGDINGKRARVLGITPQDGVQIIESLVPLAEVQRYAIDLRAMTQGRGSYTMEFDRYEEAPPQIIQKIVAERVGKA
jgi:elongation factor G